jgi:hypothetical protein
MAWFQPILVKISTCLGAVFVYKDTTFHHITNSLLSVVKRESIKRGFTCLALPLRPFIIDLTVYMDVSPNPGPTELKETTKHGHRIYHVKSGILPSASHPIKYARSTLFSLKQCAPSRLSIPFATVLKDLNILKTRGCRAGVRTRLRFTNNQIPFINSFCKYRRHLHMQIIDVELIPQISLLFL